MENCKGAWASFVLVSPKIPGKGWFKILHILKTYNYHLQNQLHSGKNKTGNEDQSKAQLQAVVLPGHRHLQASHAGVLSSHTPHVQCTRIHHQNRALLKHQGWASHLPKHRASRPTCPAICLQSPPSLHSLPEGLQLELQKKTWPTTSSFSAWLSFLSAIVSSKNPRILTRHCSTMT